MKRFLAAAALALATTVAFAAPLTYKIDANHTDVVASWSHFGFCNPIAHFGKVDGFITYDPAKVGDSKVEVTIPLSGLNSHVPDFDDHLRSDDFFDAANHPNITFKSTSVKSAGKDKLTVAGDLTIDRDLVRRGPRAGDLGRDHQQARRAADGQARRRGLRGHHHDQAQRLWCRQVRAERQRRSEDQHHHRSDRAQAGRLSHRRHGAGIVRCRLADGSLRRPVRASGGRLHDAARSGGGASKR